MIYSRAHNVVVYTHPIPEQVCAAIAGARKVNSSTVAVPADLFSLQLARVFGLPVPNLLELSNYDFPIQPDRKPLSHQRYMANFMVLHPRAFNLSDMGTMKTLAMLWAADFLMLRGLVKRALIVTPLSTVEQVWGNEIFRNLCGRRKSVVLHGSREERLGKLRRDVDFYIINPDGIPIGTRKTPREMVLGPIAQEIKDRKDINLIILDEFANAFKDASATRTKVMTRVVEDKPYIWPLSGTPTSKAPTDAYAPAKMLGKLQGVSFRSFQAKTMVQMGPFRWLPRSNAAEVVAQTLSPAVRFSREECIDLPECVVETRDVELSPTQAKAYKELKRDLQVVLGRGTITAMNEAGLRIKLLQIVCGAVYGQDKEVHKTDSAPRLAVLKEVIDEAGAKIIVFAPFTSVVDMLYLALREEYGDATVARVYGSTGQSARSEVFRAFESEPNPRIIVADPGTMSHGLTLVAANTIVWWGPTDRLETYAQANARIVRPGQKRKTLVCRLSSTPIEREIYKRLEEKQSLQGAILTLAEGER